MKEVIANAEKKMGKALENQEKELSRLRTGRASAALLDGIKVDYYGNTTPLGQIATVSTPDSRTITVQPWDRNAFGAIEKAILKSDLGLTPVNDGKLVRIVIPSLTEERRKELVKVAKKYTEDAKVAIRNIRREANESLKKMKNDKEISEDDLKKAQENTQKSTDSHVLEADKIFARKEKEIMEI